MCVVRSLAKVVVGKMMVWIRIGSRRMRQSDKCNLVAVVEELEEEVRVNTNMIKLRFNMEMRRVMDMEGL
jgi:hypothetical protein